MSIHRHIFKVGAWTAVSRVLGFARDMLFANVLGAGRLSDIFLAAFKLPNMFRDLLGEGTMQVVFVPMFTEHRKREAENKADIPSEHFASNIFSWLMAALLGITILGLILMPFIIMVITPGFASDPEKMQMTILVGRILFFYLIFVIGTAFLSSVLNAFSDFAWAAAMPAMLNLFLIGGLVVARHFSDDATMLYILSAAALVSGLTQTVILWLRLKRRNFGIRLIRPRLTPHIRTLFKRLGVGLVGTGFYQINIVIGTLIASFQSGAVTWLYYSDRIVQLPFAMIGLAAGTVLLTSLSDAIANNNTGALYAQQNGAIRNSLMFTLPCVAGLVVLAMPIVGILFEHGAWTHESTIATARAIMIMALVLPAMTTSQIYSRTLYAAQDVKTPVVTSIISLAAAVAVYLTLVGFIGYLAVPIGTVVSGYLKNLLLARICMRRKLFKFQRRTIVSVTLFGALSAVMGAGLWWANAGGYIRGIFSLGIAISAAGAAYLAIAWTANKKIK
ncbi:MAG: murein biosynthesis integral membrane protein MurJ [Proteobacteria bacterium]|nr:murein biosynthesis integral membrane protein MurJ [Pseudomonadota bacterium]